MKRALIAAAAVPILLLSSLHPVAAQSYGWSYGEEPRFVRPFRGYEPPPPSGRYEPRPVWREMERPTWREQRGWPSRFDRFEDDREVIERRPIPATPITPYQRQGADFEPPSASLRDGGPRPPVQPMPPQFVPFHGSYAPGTIVIDTGGRQLLLITTKRSALRYPISVGRDGFQWTGTEKISRIAEWPDWHPPAEMRKRDPSLPEKMTGGIRNPLGAKALYLGNSLYRIHGTNDSRTVGHASSSGCFRMLNGHVVDLAERVKIGTTVVVVARLPRGSLGEAQWSPAPSFDRPRSRYE